MKNLNTILIASLLLTACGGNSSKDTEQAAAEQPAAEQPAAEQPAAEQPVAEQSLDDQITIELASPSGLDMNIDNNDVSVQWRPVTGATSYNVYVSESKYVTANDTQYSVETTSFDHTAFVGSINSYRIQAVHNNVTSNLSTIIRADLTHNASTIIDTSTGL